MQPVNRVCSKSKGLKTLNKYLKACGLPELGNDTTDPSLAAAADPTTSAASSGYNAPAPVVVDTASAAAADNLSPLPASLSGYMTDMLPEQPFAVVAPQPLRIVGSTDHSADSADEFAEKAIEDEMDFFECLD